MGHVSVLMLLAVALVAAVEDLRDRRIPNWLTFCGVTISLILSLVSDGLRRTNGGQQFASVVADVSLMQALLGLVVVGILPLVLYATNSGGAGDVKLAWVIGAVLGIGQGIPAILSAYVLASAWGLVWLTLTGRLGTVIYVTLKSVGHCFLPRRVGSPAAQDWATVSDKVAMAPFMMAGILIALISGSTT